MSSVSCLLKVKGDLSITSYYGLRETPHSCKLMRNKEGTYRCACNKWSIWPLSARTSEWKKSAATRGKANRRKREPMNSVETRSSPRTSLLVSWVVS
ncbi:hypothetical protein Zmor_003998 [Zophobas morio]|uniref:Uncharacterized protein n=1 Tax=Zophobas morio TaxID=2755281 RepID=A0AA38HKV1_9CUCU|nr:hypothetical protein Zmor_003998 [Zophobas morio]